MRVTGEKTVHVFCEGTPNSLDASLLDRVVPSGVQIVPSHGKGGLTRFVEGYFSTAETSSPKFIIFRDRDFDVEPSHDGLISQENGKKTVFLTNRTCIESYFLDGSLFHQYWEYVFENSFSWRFGRPPGVKALEDRFYEMAWNLRDYQAVRWSLARLKPQPRWPSIANQLDRPTHELDRLLVRQDCIDGAERLIERFHGEISNISKETFHQHLEHYSRFFNEKTFWNGFQYKQYFSGRDILNHLENHPSEPWPFMSGYLSWAVRNIQWRDFADFVELSEKIEKT